jgi:hypothetical protein
MGGAYLAVSRSTMMELGYTMHDARADDHLNAAIEVLEALECLLYLMGEGAATPQQLKTYVHEAKKVLCAPRRCFLQ